MEEVTLKIPDKGAVLKAVRAAIAKAGGGRITRKQFLALSGMKYCDALRYHSGWNALLRDAGCNLDAANSKTDPARLLSDWGGVVRKLKRVPSMNEYRVQGEFNPTTFIYHFGAWSNVAGRFRSFAARRSSWKDVMELLPPSRRGEEDMMRAKKEEASLLRGASVQRLAGRPVCGEPLGMGGVMRNAPINEQGVVFLFAILAERLGFRVEGLQPGFPDCEAKRRVGDGAWQTVRIEFEYESRNFRVHRHDVEGCDLIVCWVHNWAECPAQLEVIALGEEVARLAEARRE